MDVNEPPCCLSTARNGDVITNIDVPIETISTNQTIASLYVTDPDADDANHVFEFEVVDVTSSTLDANAQKYFA